MNKTNEISFQERYNAILEEYLLTPGTLAAKAGLPESKAAPFYKYGKGIIKKPNAKSMALILKALPDLNPEYLHHGKGDIRLAKPTVNVQAAEVDFAELVESKIEVAELKAQVSIKDAIIAEMRLEFLEMKTEIISLRSEVKEWQQAYRSITEHAMGYDKEGIKIGSDNLPTDPATFRPQAPYRPAGYHAETLQVERVGARA